MKRKLSRPSKAIWVLPLACACSVSQLSAQTPSAGSSLVAQPIPDRTVPFSVADPGVAKPIIWGMDAGGWTNPVIWRTGVSYLGAPNVLLTRVPAFPTDTLYGNALQPRQKALVKERLDMAAAAGHSLQIMLNPGGGEIAWYSRDAVGYARYALLMELTKNYIESFGHTVVSITGYNEPDPGYAGVSKQNFYDLIAACKARPGLSKLRFCGGNTLNNDLALDWYNYVRPAGLTEGNTHQLAGVFDTYANFYQTVRANGDYATNDEVHDIMEGIVGAQYGLQAGIYWGYANLARGEFSQASYTGKRLGYAEHRPNWTAAAVYRKADGQLRAFCGASERQATTTTYSYVAKDRDVYYEGYGPQREYSLVMPGGSGYMTNDQPYAERVVNITWGEDVQQPITSGQYVLVNRATGKVMQVEGGLTTNGANIQQGTYAGATSQQWNVAPVSTRVGGDFSYFSILAVHSGKSLDDYGFSLDDGARITQWDNTVGANQQRYLDYADNGWFYIRSRNSTKALDLAANGLDVVQQEKNPSSQSQQWRFLPVGAAVEFAAPSAPTGLTATASAESVRLNWTASPEADVAGYTILRAEAASGPFNTIARNVPGTAFVDNTATTTGQYFYKIKAVDKSLNRSAYSNQAAATTTGSRDLVAQLRFEGSPLDNSANLNHGAPYGGASYVAGKVGSNALALNGSNAFVQLPATLANQPEITVAAWVYWSGGGAWQRIFDFGNDQSQYLFLTPNNGAGSLRFGIRNGGAEQTLDAPALAPNTWAHVAVTLGATGARLFVNGQKVAESASITIRPLDFKPVLNYLGRSQFADPLFSGRLDEVRVYNYALAPVEVASLAAPGTYYQLRNRTTGLYLDGMGRTANGDNCGQYGSGTTHPNSFWALREVGGGYYQVQNQGTGLYLDGMGRTANGDICGQYGNSGSPNQHWAVEQFDGDFYRIRNRATSLYLDGLGRTTNGADAGQWATTTSSNAQWNFVSPATTAARLATTLAAQPAAESSNKLLLYPNPVSDVLHLGLPLGSRAAQARLLNVAGQVVRTMSLTSLDNQVQVRDLPIGLYLIEVTTATETIRLRFTKE